MQFQFDLDITGIVAAATAPERIQPILDKAITKALESAIEDATGYSSEYRKSLKAQLAAALPCGIEIDTVAKFQHVLNAAISSAVAGSNAETLRVAMAKVAGEVTPDVPSRVKLSELLELARNGLHKQPEDAFYAHFERTDYGYCHLSLDGDEDTRSEYSANIRIACDEGGKVYSLKLDGANLTPISAPNAIGQWKGLLLSMYVGRTTLDIDMDADDVSDFARAKDDY